MMQASEMESDDTEDAMNSSDSSSARDGADSGENPQSELNDIDDDVPKGMLPLFPPPTNVSFGLGQSELMSQGVRHSVRKNSYYYGNLEELEKLVGSRALTDTQEHREPFNALANEPGLNPQMSEKV